jgi:hypothetical protein
MGAMLTQALVGLWLVVVVAQGIAHAVAARKMLYLREAEQRPFVPPGRVAFPFLGGRWPAPGIVALLAWGVVLARVVPRRLREGDVAYARLLTLRGLDRPTRRVV